MQSKMTEEVDLFDFELLNTIIENNQKIKRMSASTSPKIDSLVLYLLKVVEFPKKPLLFAPRILKVYSNVIANSDNQKINDLIVDVVLREEEFFQIQGILLGKKYRSTFAPRPDHFFIAENFLKGVAGILRNQSIRMVKKKFYTIFNKMEAMEFYFEHLNCLFQMNVEEISMMEGKEGESPVVIEDEINELGKRYLSTVSSSSLI